MKYIYTILIVIATSGFSIAQTNDCSTAAAGELSVGTVCNYTNMNSTNGTDYWNSAAGCGADDRDDVWMWFTATATSTIVSYQPDGNRDAILHLFSGACATNMTSVGCSNAGGNGVLETITYATTIGAVYKIRVQRSGSNNNMNGQICVYSPPPSPAGSDCASPNIIGSLPYTQTGLTTSGFGDDYNSADACGSSYMNGDDYVFEYTPATNECVDITLTNTGSYTGVFVLDGCPDAASTSCVDSDTQLSGDPEITQVSLVGGTTYYIVVSTYPAPQSTSFDIAISTVPCPVVPPNDLCANATNLPCGTSGLAGTTVNATTVTDGTGCTISDVGVWYTFVGDGQQTTISVDASYNVELAVASGSCGSLTNISCTDGGNPETYTFITTNGVVYYVYVADYWSTGTITGTFTISRTCNAPPPPATNDECSTAIVAPVNSGLTCGSSVSGTVLNATASPQDATACFGTEDDDVWFSFVATSANHNITLSNIVGSVTDMYHSVWTGTCPNLTLVAGTCSDPNIQYLTGLTVGQTYYIRVYTYTSTGGQNTTFDLCITTPVTATNDECTTAISVPVNPDLLCNSIVTGTVLGATASAQSDGGCFGTDDDDVWFSFVATSDYHNISLSNISGSVTDMYHSVWEGPCNSMTLVPGSCSDGNSQSLSGLTIGQTYYIRVYTYTSTGGQNTVFDLCITTPVPTPGQDCGFPLLLCNTSFSVGDPGYSAIGNFDDFSGSGNCTGGEKNSMWIQIDIASSGDLNFNIIPNDADVTNEGLETDYDFVLWKMSGSGTTTDCATIMSSGGDNEIACNYSFVGVTGVAPGGNAPAGFDPAFDAGYEPTVIATAGDVYFLVIQNFSSSTSGFTVDFSTSAGGVVDYSAPSTVYWTGATDDTWTPFNNWGNCTVFPQCGISAIVTGGITNQPNIATGTEYVDDITINPGATLTLANNATLHVCGDFTNNGNIVFGANSNIVFDGTNTVQNINGTCVGANAFGNFSINKTGGSVILNTDIEIAGDFTNANNTSVIDVNGFDITIRGDFSNYNGNTTYGNGSVNVSTLRFLGSGQQNYNQGLSDLDLENVLINNSGAGVNLNTDMNVGGVLSLSTGVITTNTHEVHMTNDLPLAITGHSGNSYVVGNLRREIQSLGSYDFPVGHATKQYQLANIEFTTATLITNLVARFDLYPGAIPTQGGTECLTTYNLPNLDNGIWTIDANALATTGIYNCNLYPTNFTNSGGASGWTVTKKPSIALGTWGLFGSCIAASTAGHVIRHNMVGFSAFGVAQSTVPLAVTLVSFDGKAQGEDNHLFWQTASEMNSDYFKLLRSEDGYDFTEIARVDAAGHSNQTLSYESIDSYSPESAYYQLVSVDVNGSESYSNVVYLSRKKTRFTEIRPNPADNYLELVYSSEVNDELDLSIYDVSGKLVYAKQLNANSGRQSFNINLNDLSRGVYHITLHNLDKSYFYSEKLIKL